MLFLRRPDPAVMRADSVVMTVWYHLGIGAGLCGVDKKKRRWHSCRRPMRQVALLSLSQKNIYPGLLV
jgi:hypothetical protein